MGLLFVNESSASISIENNRCIVNYLDGEKRMVPIETLESITIMGNARMSTQCVTTCLKRGIPVSYFSKGGTYFGKLQSTGHINPSRQRMQCSLYESSYAMELSKRLIAAKLKNQSVVLRRYSRSQQKDVSQMIRMLNICQNKVETCQTIAEIMGHEGQGAKAYFDGLSQLVESDFSFHGRNRRPPKDEFNSMLSLGYSIIMNEIYGKIEAKGLNPYFGFLHRDHENHPTLASDLMEEWRPVIVDTIVMSLINGHEISKNDFTIDLDEPGCYLTKNGIRVFINKLEKKLQTEVKYLDYVDYSVSFREAMSLQVNRLVKSMEQKDASIYIPIEIR